MQTRRDRESETNVKWCKMHSVADCQLHCVTGTKQSRRVRTKQMERWESSAHFVIEENVKLAAENCAEEAPPGPLQSLGGQFH